MVDRSIIARLLGNVKSPKVLDKFISCIRIRWAYETIGGGRNTISRTGNPRSDAEVIIGAKIARAFTYLATRTYEGRPLVSGMMVVEKWALEIASDYLPPWILSFKKPISLPVDSLSQMENLAQLADGKNSLLLADTLGKLYGVVDVEGADLEVTSINYGGYLFITTHNHEVALFGGAAPVCHYNGFEWRSGMPRESVQEVVFWTWGEDIQEKGLENVVHERSKAFIDIVEQLSDLRLSSIIAVCDKLEFHKLKDKGLIQPLRPELDNVDWFRFETPPRSYLKIFRLDGVHFVSKEFRLIAACQKVITEPSEGTSEVGTGKGAARHLSKLLGKSGYVIKVSSDGPISVFHDGRLSERKESLVYLKRVE